MNKEELLEIEKMKDIPDAVIQLKYLTYLKKERDESKKQL